MIVLDIRDFGAVPGPDRDNTTSVQNAIDAAAVGDTILVPGGITDEYRVDPLRSVKLRSGITLQIDGAIRAIPCNSTDSVVVDVHDVKDVNVVGSGSIFGERYLNKGDPPARHGLCLRVLNSENVKVSGLSLREGQADGLYIQAVRNCLVDRVQCIDNARNGCSVISCEGCTIRNSLFALTHSESPMPQAGIDIEPDPVPAGQASMPVIDLGITNNRFMCNKGAGVYVALGNSSNIHRVHVVSNAFDQHYKDGMGPPIRGADDGTGWFLYSIFRWVPGYDWWAFSTDFNRT